MNASFNVAELRSNIGEDAEIECALLAAFLESTASSLAMLKKEFPAGGSDAYNSLWKSHMHQIKGAALNVCAPVLAQAAAKGQQEYTAEPAAKQALLHRVSAEWDAVKAAITQLYPGL